MVSQDGDAAGTSNTALVREESLRLAIEAASLETWFHDLQTGEVTWTGLRPTPEGEARMTLRLPYEAFVAMVHPDDRVAVTEAVTEAVEQGTDYRMDFRIIWPNGIVRWKTAQGRAFYDDQKRPVRLIGMNVDITQRKSAEEALRQREAQLAEAQRVAHLGSWEWDVVADRVTWSDEKYRIWGLPPDHWPLTYQVVLDHVHPDDRPRFEEAVAVTYRAGSPYECEHRIIRPDGQIRWLQSRGTAVLDEAGRTVRMYGTAQDITERHLAGEALRRREQEFRALVEYAPDIILRFDRALRLAYVNPAGERALGRPAAALRGATIREAGMATADAASWEMALRQAFSVGREQTIEATSPDRERHYQARLTPLLGLEGDVESVLGIVRDVSERRRMDEEREQLYREMIAHEARLRESVERILLDRETRRRQKLEAAERPTLTERDRAILRHLVEGRTNQEIGRAIGLSPGTVKNHLSTLLPRLGAVDRTQAAARAIEWDLLD